jgi:hypothetical protein
LDDEEYQHRNISAEMCDSDDLAGDLNLSDCEDNSNVRQEIKKSKKNERKKKGKNKKANKYVVEVDTNVFQVSLACLKNDVELATGDPELCKKCNAVFNSFSKITVNQVS